MPNYSDYQKSISDELISVKDRIRNFIDDHHWPEDGRYKEIILSDVLRRHLPKSVSVGTGFIAEGKNLSTQIDIIVYRNEIPLLFQKSDFVIVAPEAVLGIIEVKSRIRDRRMLSEAIDKLSRIQFLAGSKIFTGLFAFEVDERFEYGNTRQYLEQSLCASNGCVNHLCLGPDYFVKYWQENSPRQNESNAHYSIYHLHKLAFGYFISNLVEDVYIATTGNQLPQSLHYVFYPIENTKEAFMADVVVLPAGKPSDDNTAVGNRQSKENCSTSADNVMNNIFEGKLELVNIQNHLASIPPSIDTDVNEAAPRDITERIPDGCVAFLPQYIHKNRSGLPQYLNGTVNGRKAGVAYYDIQKFDLEQFDNLSISDVMEKIMSIGRPIPAVVTSVSQRGLYTLSLYNTGLALQDIFDWHKQE